MADLSAMVAAVEESKVSLAEAKNNYYEGREKDSYVVYDAAYQAHFNACHELQVEINDLVQLAYDEFQPAFSLHGNDEPNYENVTGSTGQTE